ncbi:histidine phosphatase family protein [Betaproteobacteria bacterium]|nr:histidine phosphatase family protein [Betaproteobacteria bacterium]
MGKQIGIKKKIQGHTNTDLDGDGQRESIAISKALDKENIELIFSSPLKRAYSTVEPLARKKQKAIICSKNLIERGLGIVEGFEIGNINSAKAYEQKLILLKTAEINYRPNGGESLNDVSIRVKEFLDFLSIINIKGVVVCMTHGGVLDVLYRIIMNKALSSERKWVIPNGAFFLLERYESDFKIIKWAETNHLNTGGMLDEY